MFRIPVSLVDSGATNADTWRPGDTPPPRTRCTEGERAGSPGDDSPGRGECRDTPVQPVTPGAGTAHEVAFAAAQEIVTDELNATGLGASSPFAFTSTVGGTLEALTVTKSERVPPTPVQLNTND